MRVFAAVAALLLSALTGCGASDQEPAGEDAASSSEPVPTDDPAPITAEDYDPALFDDAANIDNQWYPLTPGRRLTYEGSSLEDGERIRHTVDTVVTDLVKVIDGVPNVVVWERDYDDGQLVEAELALFAQDVYGNVWHMGEYPEEYEDGKLDKAPAWIHGVAGARAGITFPGDPQVGTPEYSQGYAPPPINWVDMGRVRRTGEDVCVPAGCYRDVVIIAEFETGLPHAFQDKYYAPGSGVVYVGWRGFKDDSKEVLRLVADEQLTPEQLAAARQDALALEKRAYEIRPNVYGQTEAAKRRGL